MTHRVRAVSLVVAALLLSASSLIAQQPNSAEFSALHWRLIGPFRAGRVTAVAGVPGDPNTFYFGTPGGGVWKTVDAGQVWDPIFDSVRVASIGALAVAPSDPRIIYVGTGEQTRGNGLYRSNDAGATWKRVGLDDVLFIQAIVVDPRNPDVVVVAGNSVGIGILWQPLPRWAWTANRGIYKTTDGGKTWKKVYTNDKTLGIMDMCSDLSDPRTLYAAAYTPASGSGEAKIEGTSEILRSTDEGSTWAPLRSHGLPEKGRKRLGIIVAPGTHGRRLYAIMKQGFFRSDDAGATWQQSTHDPRVIGSDYFSRLFVDPNNPDVVYAAQTSAYRSTDGGKTFEAFAGAPSGDDFHVLWIDQKDSRRMFFGVDQGAIVSMNGGKTWSSWYNQPTGQFYHVSTDNLFPYRVYGAQQDSGTAGVLSRSNYGEIMAQDWFSTGGFEYAFITPDPAHPNLVYSNGWYGSVVRLDKNTGQIATVFEKGNKYRTGQMPPLVFSPQDPSVLYLGTQYVLKTGDGGLTWQPISPDLTGYVEEKEEKGKEEPGRPHPPTITALSPSTLQPGEMWAGTSNRLIYVTRDAGASWKNVSPSGLAEPEQIVYVEASHHDPATAYVTVSSLREATPANVLRTHDYGQSWQKIVNGFPENETVRVVREDTQRKGLLFAGTDTSVFVSWDDGEHWQPLSLNLPPTPVTDLEVHGNDLAISTFGRGLWILDDIASLRNINPEVAASDVYLFPPETGMRVRWDNYTDTPYPRETPAGENPPDGAIIDYFLKAPAQGALQLTISDQKGAEIARFSNQEKAAHPLPPNVPEYWFAPATELPNVAGVNRFVWNLRYPTPPSLPFGYYGELLEYQEYTLADHAIPGLTPRSQPPGALVPPGKYTVELRYGGKVMRQPLTIELDPRVHASAQDLEAQADLALELGRGMASSYDAYHQVTALRKALADRQEVVKQGDAKLKDAAEKLEKEITDLQKGPKASPGFGPVNRDLGRLLSSVESADMHPAEAVQTAVRETCTRLETDLSTWQRLNAEDVPAFNSLLAGAKGQNLPVSTVATKGCK